VQEVVDEALFDFKREVKVDNMGCNYGASRTVLRSADRECCAWFIRKGFGAIFVFKNGKSGYNAMHFCKTDFITEQVGTMQEVSPVLVMRYIERCGGTLTKSVEEVQQEMYGEKIGTISKISDKTKQRTHSDWEYFGMGCEYEIFHNKKGVYKGVEIPKDDFALRTTGELLPAAIIDAIDKENFKADIQKEELDKIRAMALGEKL
jgi:hypothetical protein